MAADPILLERQRATERYEHKKREQITLLPSSVPGPGIEPGWIAPTVFETVASTDSAIRADGGGFALGKVTKFFLFLTRGGNYFAWLDFGGGFTGDFRRCSPEAGSRPFDGAQSGGWRRDGFASARQTAGKPAARGQKREEGKQGEWGRPGGVIFCGGRCSRCRF